MIFDKNLTWKSYICSPHLSDVATWPWEVQKSFSTVLFIYTSDCLWYRRRKQLIHFSWRKAAHLNPAVGGTVSSLCRSEQSPVAKHFMNLSQKIAFGSNSLPNIVQINIWFAVPLLWFLCMFPYFILPYAGGCGGIIPLIPPVDPTLCQGISFRCCWGDTLLTVRYIRLCLLCRLRNINCVNISANCIG